MFGLVVCSQRLALGYMEIVQNRTAATLLPIIQGRVRPGTTVHSDEWSAYRTVQGLPNVQNYQNVESYWARVKLKFKRMKGVDVDQLPSYLDEFMWRERHGTTAGEAFNNILDHIADIYPV